MIWNMLADENSGNQSGNQYMIYILLAVIVVVFVVWLLLSNRKGKQRQKEYTEQLDAIAPGHKVKTIGGICGIVVEVCDDNTVIIETGSEQSGKSYCKMDKECIAQTDAKGPTQIAREQAEAAKAAAKQAKKEGASVAEPQTEQLGEPAAKSQTEQLEEPAASEQAEVKEPDNQ